MNNEKKLKNIMFKHCTTTFSENEIIKNFSITFGNGYTLSLAMGYGMGSERINEPNNYDEYKTVEFAIIAPNNKLLKLPSGDDVERWATPERVLEIMNFVSEIKNG